MTRTNRGLRGTYAPRLARPGFTLVELMVVIAILALLVAITAAGVGRVKSAQQVRATEQTLDKLQFALDSQWKAVIDQCGEDRRTGRNPQFEALTQTCCNGDRDRAQALWTYMNLMREFPQTFTEATSNLTIGPVTLAPRATFKTAGSKGTPPDPSAALLYLNLSEKGTRGMNFNADDVTGGAQMNDANGYRVFKDTWGNPVGFIRWATYSEVQAPPFVNPNAIRDPLDPLGKLANWPDPNNPSQQSPYKAIAQAALGVTFDGVTNRVITVYSLGPNQAFENNPTGYTDDVFGYRLRRLGTQGG